jgi:hypothetical protein
MAPQKMLLAMASWAAGRFAGHIALRISSLRNTLLTVGSVVLGAAIAAVVYLLLVHFNLISMEHAPSPPKPPPAETPKASVSLPMGPKSAKDKAGAAEMVEVNSVPVGQQYPLTDWNVIVHYAGYIDRITVDGAEQAGDGALRLGADSVIELAGWAGHGEFGMRIERVLISVCQRIVAIAPVDAARPDVAKNVHMNLRNAGWHARLARAHLPVCDQPKLLVWALAPIGFNIYPLRGGRVLAMAPGAGPATAQAGSAAGTGSVANPPVGGAAKTFVSLAPLERRSDRGVPKTVKLRIKSAALRIRRCPSTDCKSVGKFRRGVYDGYIVDQAENWILVQAGKHSGWIYLPYVEVGG